jgi:diguanylate cyclase (GGDEF)-like protein
VQVTHTGGLPVEAQDRPRPCRWTGVWRSGSERLVSTLRRGDVLPPAAVAIPGDPRTGELTTRSSLRHFVHAAPGLRDELVERARSAGLLICWVAVLLVPAWTLVDRIEVPERAGVFLAVRLLCDVPLLLAMWALWRLPIGRRRPEQLSFLVLAVVQMEIAWMVVQTNGSGYYLLGFTVAVYGSGCIIVARPRWTAALVGVSWAALGAAALADPGRLTVEDLVALTLYLGTASIIAILAHLRRYALNNRELVTRIRLEREQQRTGVLLAELERLSNEDPLTGLANRRRWDAQLTATCAAARQNGDAVAVVLLDIDHFKRVNDRHGHGGGDAALRAVAAMLTRGLRSGDLVARLGGDELAVLLPGAGLDRAVELAERVRLEATRLQPPGFEAGELTLSLGVAAAAGGHVQAGELMSRADEQLYRAKVTRNSVGAPASGAVLPG